jgi:hypothetical protein
MLLRNLAQSIWLGTTYNLIYLILVNPDYPDWSYTANFSLIPARNHLWT